jgi:diaminohydroxyphosphoribosylaminopyrimidine deaminase/5-amino-6-(5-phosphoribosylamino)uracil reductase
LRVTIDKDLKLKNDYSLFDDAAPTLVFNRHEDSVNGNIERVKINFNEDAEEQILEQLHKRNILSVIIEGGPTLLNSFIAKGLWDEARVFTAKTTLNKGKKAPVVDDKIIDEMELGGDKLVVKIKAL